MKQDTQKQSYEQLMRQSHERIADIVIKLLRYWAGDGHGTVVSITRYKITKFLREQKIKLSPRTRHTVIRVLKCLVLRLYGQAQLGKWWYVFMIPTNVLKEMTDDELKQVVLICISRKIYAREHTKASA